MKYWKRSKLYRCALVLGVSAAVNSFHSAQTLAGDACRVVFAHGAAVSSLDPHYNVVTPNHAISEHIFSTLVLQDENLRIQPGLAKSWEVSSEDNKVWTFHLRDDVKWHDGEKFTADDVLFTFNRVPTVENSPSSYSIYTQPVAKIEVLDEHTIRFTTHDVFTLLPQYVARLAIIPRHAAEGKKSSDYDQGVATIGTGPYKYKEYTPGEKIVLTRNEDYWGNIPQVKEVEFRFISNNATRVAALLSGDVDIIDSVPTTDAAALKSRNGVRVESTAGVRNIYLYLDQGGEQTPFVFDNDERPLEKNPLTDRRVREALSKAINRDAIVKAVMNEQASPSGQLLPKGVMGHVDDLAPPAYDPEGARELLAEAGYPDGFRLTLHGPNDRYINDSEVVQAVAQMWSRVGVKTAVDAMPSSVYFTRASKSEFSVGLLGWGTGTGEPDSPMVAVLATPDADRGRGTSNRSRYSSAEFDAQLDKALATIDIGEREKVYREATRFAMNDVAIIPLHHQFNIWAMRERLAYVPQVNEQSLAMNISISGDECN
jgi:peptide/nickel transport system substrate-binding protein